MVSTYAKLLISGIQYNDSDKIVVNSTMSESNASSDCEINFWNTAGRHKTDFTVGNEIVIYAGSVYPPTTKIFTGVLKDINFEGEGYSEKLTLTGGDYANRLTEFTVEPRVFINENVGSIVYKIMQDYTEGLTYSGIQSTSTSIERIKFSQVPVLDAIKELADRVGYIYYVDNEKDLHFEPAGSISSGYTFNNTNVISSNIRDSDQELANDIWVYGGNYFLSKSESFNPGSEVYTLEHKPHNTQVYEAGVLKVGDITIVSGADYWVDFDQRNINFISGTFYGDHIPTGSPVLINYDRSVPIIARDQDQDSINSYGRRVKIIQDDNIKDLTTAWNVVAMNLNLYKNPRKIGTLELNGIHTVNAGNTCIVNLPNENINNQTYNILSAKYNLNPQDSLTNNHLRIEVSQYVKDITDIIKSLMLSIKKIETDSLMTDGLWQSYQFRPGSIGAEVSSWLVQTRNIGSSFILGHNVNGLLGSYANHVLGDWRSALTTQQSGGTWL